MKEERMKILTMLQEGKITTEEAERLLAAIAGSARAEHGEGPGRGRRHGWWEPDFDFEPHFRKFGLICDEDFRRKFQEKAREFKNSMRWGDEEARRQARDAFRHATEAVKDAFERSNLKETVEEVGKSVLDAMEQAMRGFSGTSPKADESGAEKKPDEPPKSSQGPEGGTTV